MSDTHQTPTAPRNASAEFLALLQNRFGAQLSTALAMREQHGSDESGMTAPAPDAVVFAENTQDVADLLALANAHNVPVIAYGAGSSLEGSLLAIEGGITLNVSRMNEIVSINADDLTVTVQPGVSRKQLNEALKHLGLFFPIDPGADASIGGMAATRASGTNAVRYGTMRENVLALEVVTAAGEVIRTGTHAKKSSAGYDLTRLYVGSAGTLGIMTELTVKLYPLPEAVSSAICSFPSVADAVRTVITTIQLGVPIARVELLDGHTVGLVNKFSKLSLREEPMLLMEFHGSPAYVKEQAETVQELAADNNGNAFEWANTPEERTRLWTARHNAYFAGVQSRPGLHAITTDVCVPISRLADALLESVDEVQAAGIEYILVGHVGDGNFHFAYLVDADDAAAIAQAEDLNHRLVTRALRMNGTCTGEHGIGIHKMGFLREEAGAGGIAVMRSIKHALDPKNILNPGKIFTFEA